MIRGKKHSKKRLTLEELKAALEELMCSQSEEPEEIYDESLSEREILEEEVENYEKEMEARERVSNFIEEKLKDLYFRDIRNIFPLFFGRRRGDLTSFDEVVYEEIFREAAERFLSMLEARKNGENAS